MKQAYIPRLQRTGANDYIYKQVRIQRTASGRPTTVSFDWLAYSTLLRDRNLSPRQFGRLVREAYEQLEALGFDSDQAVSRQVWTHLQARFQR